MRERACAANMQSDDSDDQQVRFYSFNHIKLFRSTLPLFTLMVLSATNRKAVRLALAVVPDLSQLLSRPLTLSLELLVGLICASAIAHVWIPVARLMPFPFTCIDLSLLYPFEAHWCC